MRESVVVMPHVNDRLTARFAPAVPTGTLNKTQMPRVPRQRLFAVRTLQGTSAAGSGPSQRRNGHVTINGKCPRVPLQASEAPG
jgi:hypothetical protein